MPACASFIGKHLSRLHLPGIPNELFVIACPSIIGTSLVPSVIASPDAFRDEAIPTPIKELPEIASAKYASQ